MKPYTILDVPQRSPEWYAARCGRLCASQAKDMLAQIKNGEAAARRDLRMQLVVERLTGRPQDDGYLNADMQRGIELEADAIAAYEAHTGNLVERVGFVQHSTLMIGCSPDGSIDDLRGGVEVKVPRSATHLRYLRTGGLPAEYVGQIRHSLWTTGAEWWDFASYDPRFPEPLRLFVYRVPRVEIDVLSYAKCAEAFLAEVEAELNDVLQIQAMQATA